MLSVPVNSSQRTASSNDSTENESQDVEIPWSRYILFFGLAIIGGGLDLVSKTFVFSRFYDVNSAELGNGQAPHWWWDGVFGIQTSHNPGALFGLGAGYSWVFAVISIAAMVGMIVWLFVFRAARDRWLTTALGLVLGGIFGNLYDRLGWGYVQGFPEAVRDNVRDWILFRLDGVPFFDPWPNFNIADSLLVSGAVLLFLHAFFVVPAAEHEVDVDPEKS